MTVSELRALLKRLPADMEILNGRYSDYCLVNADEWKVVKAVPKPDCGYVMRSHATMSAENKAAEKEYLYLEGN